MTNKDNATNCRVVIDRKNLAEDEGDNVFVIGESIGYLVNVLAREIRQGLNRRLQEHGASAGQWPILLFLWETDGLTQKELGERIPFEGATIARTLDRMTRDGLVRRERDPSDRRRVQVWLTDEGLALKDVLIPRAREAIGMALDGFEPEEVDVLRNGLRRVLANVTRGNET